MTTHSATQLDQTPLDSATDERVRRRRLISSIIVASILIHLLFGVFAGVWVVAQYFTRPPAVFEVSKTILPPTKPEHRLDMAKVDSMAPAPSFNHKIQSLRPSPLALPELPKIETTSSMAFDPSSLMSTGSEGLIGAGVGSGTGVVFGMKLDAKRLGVILDVSFSTHKLLDKAMAEIEKSFPDTLVVLTPGCGILEGHDGKVYTARSYENQKDRIPKNKPGMFAFLYNPHNPANPTWTGLFEANKKFEEFYERAKKENRMYILNQEKPETGFGITANAAAFEFLAKQNIDGIYWFADFEDKIDESVASKLVGQMKNRGIKVYQHALGKAAMKDPLKTILSRETGGDINFAEVQ